MQYIKSNKGNLYIIDDIDIELLNYYWGEDSNGYIQRYINNENEYLHIIIAKRMGIYVKNLEIDHKDRDVTNNCRNNLRRATSSQNKQNVEKYKYRSTSRYKGVSYTQRDNRWAYNISVNGIKFRKANFKTEIEAAKAYNEQAKYYFGEFAVLNEIDE